MRSSSPSGSHEVLLNEDHYEWMGVAAERPYRMNDVQPALDERRREWIAVVSEGDLEGYADLVTEDVVWLPPSGEPVTGREAFSAWLRPFFTRYDYRFSVEPVQVRMFDGWCAEIGRFRSILTADEDAAPQEHTGEYFVLWRLDSDETWRIERYVDGVGSDRLT